mgnify:CR=1 FL=1|tara:strand:- start:368 stop:577 length:210 start_codon:yes stop_codon:yes gene_type:complete
MMRTNIDINEDLLNEYKKLVGAKTKKEAIHHALQDAIKAAKKRQLANMMGKVKWEGNLEKMRTYDKWEE